MSNLTIILVAINTAALVGILMLTLNVHRITIAQNDCLLNDNIAACDWLEEVQ